MTLKLPVIQVSWEKSPKCIIIYINSKQLTLKNTKVGAAVT